MNQSQVVGRILQAAGMYELPEVELCLEDDDVSLEWWASSWVFTIYINPFGEVSYNLLSRRGTPHYVHGRVDYDGCSPEFFHTTWRTLQEEGV